MYTLAPFVALLAASAVSAVPVDLVTRSEKPATYAEGYLENYTVYHTRYLALDCQDKHNTDFFDACCHPLLATESLAKNRAPECTPSPSASASASAAEPTSTVEADDGTEDCEDEPAPSPSPSPSPAPSPSPSPKKADPKPTTTEKKQEAQPTTTEKKVAAAAASPSPSPSNDNKNNNNNSGSSSGANLIQGGHITFFDQNGVAGACGKVHSDNDLIAAMDSQRYGNGELCGKQVTIKNKSNGKQVTVTVADECPTCDNGNSIDLSRGAFEKLASFDVGLLTDVEWSLN